ncbi:MAG: STAS domain-containing protein [Desulfobacteraceae bacterium]|nr:MAG: STAS domain-containing protein [Desulfobacteraceae bacterium]
MNCERKSLKTKTVLTLSGELTLPFALRLREVLSEAVSQADRVAVKFKQVTDADLSLLQMLCSAHRGAVRRNKQLEIEGKTPEVLTGLIKAAGFQRHQSCRFSNDRRNCLWIEGDR